MSWRRPLLGGVFLATILCRSLSAGPREAQDQRGVSPRSALSLGLAIEMARVHVARPGCGLLLRTYRDADARPLARNLEELGTSARAYLGWIVFAPAPDAARRCSDPSTIFFTTPRSRVVFLCGERFAALWAREPDHATALVLHETLHTLGLGENPPSAAQITANVRGKCGL